MYLNDTNLSQLIKEFSGPQNFLRKLCNEQREKCCKEIKNLEKNFEETKENIIKNVKNIFQYSTSNFKTPSPNFKYKLELMKNEDPDCMILKSSLDVGFNFTFYSTNTSSNYFNPLKQEQLVYKIYRIKTNDKNIIETKNSESSSILLLHGTKGPCVEGILKEGFRPSQSGSLGPGVYLTNSLIYAFKYGNSFVNDGETPKNLCYLFVSKVKTSNTNVVY